MKKPVLVVYREISRVRPYAQALEDSGIDPKLIEAGNSVSIEDYAGLLLTGGSDVNPARYGESALSETDPPDDERDEFESKLLDASFGRDLPVLAICRGLQMLNVHLGGSLVQHLPSIGRHRVRTPDPSLPAHQISIEPKTLLAAVAGRDNWEVNSRHHQAVAKLGQGLRVSALDRADGTIEAVEKPGNRWVLAVQWHPEDQARVDPEQRKLFDRFAGAL